jgi:hypothetical protein
VKLKQNQEKIAASRKAKQVTSPDFFTRGLWPARLID